MSPPIILASRSPRRSELLRLSVPAERIVVRPPPSAEEESFENLISLPAIMLRLLEIARHKHDQTLEILRQEGKPFAALMAAAGIAIGAAWSGLLSNFAAGAFLIVLRPFKVGDMITGGGVTAGIDFGLTIAALLRSAGAR